jgi:predicted membrane-bound spermidine synthase
MALIQKFILFLHHPIYSLSAIIASFLLVSGIGSLFSKRCLQKSVGYQIIPFIAIPIIGILYAFSLDWLFAQFGWSPLYLRLWVAFFIIAPLAFFMGMPFPFGMQRITETGEKNTGGAWGYNGFFSVMGTVVTPILAGILGFKIVGVLGCLGYVIALTVWVRKWQ